jgi:hypothetical protein
MNVMLITRLGADQTSHYRLSRSQNRSSTATSDKIDCKKSHCCDLKLHLVTITMAPSNFTPNERLVRKRLAARLRQRRCRERKRELAMTGVVPTGGSSKEGTSDSKSVEASGDNSTVYSSNKSTPTSSPSKVTPVYVDVQNGRPANPGYGWHYPTMPPCHGRGPSFQYHHQPPHPNGYYGGASQHHHHPPPMIPVMYPPHHHQYVSHPPALSYSQPQRHLSHGHHYSVPFHGPLSHGLPPPHHPLKQANPNHRLTTAAEPGDVSRTVSRSPSDASLNSGKRTVATAHIKHEIEAAVSVETQNEETSCTTVLGPISKSTENLSFSQASSHKKEKRLESKNPNSLMSTEKAAVAAMLSMKSSSDESDGDSISASTLKSLPPVPENADVQQKRQRAALPLMAAV